MNFVKDLHSHRARRYSQNGEDGVIERLFDIFGTTDRKYVEIGTGDGAECNTRNLRERGWSGIMIDAAYENPAMALHQEFVTAANVNDLFAKYAVQQELDLLSLDIDGQDYWVWQAIASCYRPRVAVIEYNEGLPSHLAVTIPYDAGYRWRGQPNAGQSLLALEKLSRQKGYSLLYAAAPNAFLVRSSMLPKDYRQVSPDTAAGNTFFHRLWKRRRWKNELRALSWVNV